MQTAAPTPPKAPQPGAFCFFAPPRRPRGRWVAALALLLALGTTAGARVESFRIAEVFDGDTVRLADGRHVRLIGINTPELGKDGAPDQPLAATARERLQALVGDRPVQVEYGTEERDHYGRWLAHLRLPDGRSVEEQLLREGLAFAIAVPPNLERLARHQAAEAEARRAGRGVWNHSYYVAADPETLTGTGFQRVRGRITHVGRSRKYVYLDMAPRFALRIGHADWGRYFGGRPEDWLGAAVEARGWVSERNGRRHMAVGHPAMIERTR